MKELLLSIARLAAFAGFAIASLVQPASPIQAQARAQAVALPQLPPEAITRIDALAQDAISSGRTAGLAIGIMVDGQVLFQRGYGLSNLETQTPVTPETVFSIGSLTKQFTAAAVMRLVEQGRLSLDDRLDRFVPDFPRGRDVTIRHLLGHLSGVHNYTESDIYRRGYRLDVTNDEMVRAIAGQTPLYVSEPGARFEYNNSGYFLLGVIIERVSGQSLADFLRTALFEPAGLRHTALDRNEEVVLHRASPYFAREGGSGSGFRNVDYNAMSVPGAAGAMRSTIGDLLRWHDALLRSRIVSETSLRTMLGPQRLNDGSMAVFPVPAGAIPGTDATPRSYYFGFGLMMRQHSDDIQEVGHRGSLRGWDSVLNSYPRKRLSIAVLSNTYHGVGGMAFQIADVVLPLIPNAPR